MPTTAIERPGVDRSQFATQQVHAQLRRHSTRGLAVTLGSRMGIFGIKLITTAILARLLVPADFGLFAMTLIVSSVAQLFTEGGLSRITIQRTELDHGEVSALFWWNVVGGMVMAALMAMTAPLMAWFYGEPGVQSIILALSATCVIAGLARQHQALLIREMRFRSTAVAQSVSVLSGAIVGVLVAFWGGGPWSLVAIAIVPAIVQSLLLWQMCSWRPGRPRWNAGVRSMLAFGGSLTTSRCLNFTTTNADNLLIGWAWGAAALGIYGRAYQLLLLPLGLITQPTANVMITALSKIKDNDARYRRYYSGALNGMMWLIGPAMALAAACAHDLVRLVLGPGWSESADVFRVLAVASLLQPIYQSLRWVLISRDRGTRLVVVSATMCVFSVTAFVAGLRWGSIGVAMGYAAVSLLLFPWYVIYALRDTGLTAWHLVKAIQWPAIASAGVYVAAEAARVLLIGESIFTRVAGCLFLAASAVLLLLTLSPQMRAEFTAFVNLSSELRATPRVAA